MSYYLGINIYNYSEVIFQLNILQYGMLILYAIMIPSFILSFQDIKNFIISKQTNVASTIV